MDRHVSVLVTGIVQGIGFRPFCSRLAEYRGLGGSVRNTPAGVRLELYGSGEAVDSFLEMLVTECPPLGHIQSVSVISDHKEPEDGPAFFSILESEDGEENLVMIPPDIATCEDCLREMKDPSDRRFRYPFINCTNCGPRFTIIRGLPYDRPATTMEPFPMCDDCHGEYVKHTNRRFHAQPTACEVCGPSLSLLDASGKTLHEGEEALIACIKHLEEGKIVAVKGLGGYHIACLPDDASVEKLRRRKQRPHKPLALMARDVETAEKTVILSPSSKLILNSPRRPIVVCPKRAKSTVSNLVAPGHDSIGVMLPYTPLHHLIMEMIPVLVMTSANLSEAPIVSENFEALESLGGIVDVFLIHNRDICMKIDDSVVALAGKKPIMLRRGRGFVPHPLIINREMPQILAAGAEMKSTFAITRDKMIFVSQYLGDLKQMRTAVYYEKTLRHFLSLFGFRPRLMAVDMHPSYPCADIARKIVGNPEEILEVQ
ncbi:MAG TPA: carbamoyltransferase HypF, partial [Synergistetes bacterium]|nr:carbamoyltransferase HypF [Synergistota bacterium]